MPGYIKFAVAAAVLAGSLAAVGGAAAADLMFAHAGLPAIYKFDQIKHSGGEANFGLMNPGVTVGFNPQPDPPGYQARLLSPTAFGGVSP